jgi:hypothetical protein
MSYNIASESIHNDITPEKALWCSVMVTFIEDMNHFVDLKIKAGQSDKTHFSLQNLHLDASGILTREKFIELLSSRMRRLIYMAKEPHIRRTFELIGISHSRFVDTLKYQYNTTSKIKLSPAEMKY